MPLCSVLSVLLSVLTLEYLMSNFLAIIVLYRPRSILKGTGYPRFSASIKEPIGQEPPYVRAFSQVNSHRPIYLRTILSTKLYNLSHSGFVLLAKGCRSLGSDLVFFIQYGGLINAINFNRVELVTEYPGSRTDLSFCYFLDQLVFIFVAVRYSDSVGILRVHGNSITAPVRMAFYRPNLCLYRRPDRASGHPLVFIFCYLRGVYCII